MTVRHKPFTISILAATFWAFVIGGAAQESQQNAQDQITQDECKPGMMNRGGMMRQGQGTIGVMGQMTIHH
jgi:hypothetical protein